MRVAVNRLAAFGNKTGIGHYTAELLRCLADQAQLDDIVCFPSNWIWRLRQCWVRLRPDPEACFSSVQVRTLHGKSHKEESLTILSPKPSPSLFARLRNTLLAPGKRWGQALLQGNQRQVLARCDLYHEPNMIPVPCARPTIVTLHDLSVLQHPEWHPAARTAYFEQNLPRTLAQCCHFLTISNFSRSEIVKHLGVAPERVSVTYMGCRPGLRPLPREQVSRTLRRLGLPAHYVLHVGTLEPRKNLEMLIRAFAALPGQLRERYPLVLVGRWGWNATRLARLLDEVGKPAGVRHLGYVANADLPALYNGARVLAFPTLYEGFGMPAVEMLACGGAVLASTAAALVEVVGGQAQLVDPQDEVGWRDALAQVLTDDDWWRTLRRGAVRTAAPFTWERCAADTIQAYRAALHPPQLWASPVVDWSPSDVAGSPDPATSQMREAKNASAKRR